MGMKSILMHHVFMTTLCVKIKFEMDINKDELLPETYENILGK
jgi:hypothetical protein